MITEKKLLFRRVFGPLEERINVPSQRNTHKYPKYSPNVGQMMSLQTVYITCTNCIYFHFIWTLYAVGQPPPNQTNKQFPTKPKIGVIWKSFKKRSFLAHILGFFILLTHEVSHREVCQEFQPSYGIFRKWCRGLFRPQVPYIYLIFTTKVFLISFYNLSEHISC